MFTKEKAAALARRRLSSGLVRKRTGSCTRITVVLVVVVTILVFSTSQHFHMPRSGLTQLSDTFYAGLRRYNNATNNNKQLISCLNKKSAILNLSTKH
jgi:hypothetical protein